MVTFAPYLYTPAPVRVAAAFTGSALRATDMFFFSKLPVTKTSENTGKL